MNNLRNFTQEKTRKKKVHQERTILTQKTPVAKGRGYKSMAIEPTNDSANQKQERDQKRQYNANNEELAK